MAFEIPGEPVECWCGKRDKKIILALDCEDENCPQRQLGLDDLAVNGVPDQAVPQSPEPEPLAGSDRDDEVSRLPDFGGATYDRDRDHERLGKQALEVWAVLQDREWHTLSSISAATGHPEASVSARIRDLRKPKFGGYEVEREFVRRGLWRYRIVSGGSASESA